MPLTILRVYLLIPAPLIVNCSVKGILPFLLSLLMNLGYQSSQITYTVIFQEDMIETDNIENLGHKTCNHMDFFSNFS